MNILYSVLNKILSVSPEEVKIDIRGFNCPSSVMVKHLEKIGHSFLKGYHNAIKKTQLHQYDLNDKMYSGFVIEGAAMGSMLVDIFLFKKGELIKELIKTYPEHVYMIHVGIGWALARVPFINIQNRIKAFDPLFQDLILDGYGFHQAYFHTKKYVYSRLQPTHLPRQLHAPFYQGIGRALWFVCGAQPQVIHNMIITFPPINHKHLWAGLGLAMAYAGDIATIELEEIKRLSEPFCAEIAQGVAFGCQARVKAQNIVPHTEEVARIFCQQSTLAVAALTTKYKPTISEEQNDERLYTIWRNSIISHFKNHLHYENIEK